MTTTAAALNVPKGSELTSMPVQKVAWSAVAGAFVTAVLLVLSASGVAVPNGLEAALTTIVTFVVGWLVPPGASESIVINARGSRSGRARG